MVFISIALCPLQFSYYFLNDVAVGSGINLTLEDLLCTHQGKSSNLLTQFLFDTIAFGFNFRLGLCQNFFTLGLGLTRCILDDLGLALVGLLNDLSGLQLG